MTARTELQPEMASPRPRVGDVFSRARVIINDARLVLPQGVPGPKSAGGGTPHRRAVVADFLRQHDVPVPDFIPVVYGWIDCFAGELANPDLEPGGDGRRFS